jgi:hypothetical protein
MRVSGHLGTPIKPHRQWQRSSWRNAAACGPCIDQVFRHKGRRLFCLFSSVKRAKCEPRAAMTQSRPTAAGQAGLKRATEGATAPIERRSSAPRTVKRNMLGYENHARCAEADADSIRSRF